MHRFVEIILLFFCYYHAHCVQPNFPSQIVFTVNNGQRLYAIDEVNQRAFVSIKDNPSQSAYELPRNETTETDNSCLQWME